MTDKNEEAFKAERHMDLPEGIPSVVSDSVKVPASKTPYEPPKFLTGRGLALADAATGPSGPSGGYGPGL